MCSTNVESMCIEGEKPKRIRPLRQAQDKQSHREAVRRRRGISIIEVAMASALLMVAMVPILKNLTRAHQLSAEMERKTNSLVLAQGKLDEIKARSIYNFGSSGSFTANNVALGGSYFCNVVDAAVGTDLRQISVSVGHDGNGSGTLSSDEVEVTLATYVARRW
jgi:Tfp pilus assembly protein PilV